MKKNQHINGFSLVEIMVSVAILTILTVLAIRPWGVGRQKEDLLKTGNQIVNLLRQAQAEAKLYGTFRGVCFKNDSASGQNLVRFYKPRIVSGSILPTNNDCTDSTELNTGPEFKFGPDVKLCTNCDSKVAMDKSIFFDKDGFTSEYTGTRSVFEICIYNPKLPAGTRAREVEIGINGDIHLLAQTEAGSYSGVVANQGNCQ